MIGRLCLVVLLAGVTTACGDDGGADCGPAAPCTALPADVAITSITIVSPATTHPVTGLPIVDSLRVRYVVRNLGDSIAPPMLARVSIDLLSDHMKDTVPAVQPRDSVVRNVTLAHTTLFYTRGPDPEFGGDHDRDRVTVALEAPAGDPHHNNFATSSPVHLALPVLEVAMQPVNEPRVRVNDPLQLSVTVTNHSPTVTARNIQLRHCLWDYDTACWAGNWTAFGNIALPDIAPGQTRTFNYTTAIPPTAMEVGFRFYGLTGCVTSRADTAVYRDSKSVLNGTWACGSAGWVEVWPDYEACAPPVLSSQPVTLTAPNCGSYPIPNEPGNWDWLAGKEFYVFALDAEAGRTYQLSGAPIYSVYTNTGIAATDLDAAPDRVRFAHPDRYYVVIAGRGSFTVTAVPLP